MAMTFDQYITNPLGKSNAVLSAAVREAIRKDYTIRFNNILLRENGRIVFYKYKTDKNSFIAHIKIPSEAVKNFYYDVVIRFYTDEKVVAAGNRLDKYNFQAYSNDPAFVFTHAFVFRKNKLFFTDLEGKMSKTALHKAPDIKNPDKQLAYVKSIYFAYLFLKNRGLFNKITWSDAVDYNPSELIKNVMDADEKVALRQEAEKKLDHRKKIEIDIDTAKKLSHMKHLSDDAKSRLVTTVKKTPTVRKIKAVNSTKTIKPKRKKY